MCYHVNSADMVAHIDSTHPTLNTCICYSQLKTQESACTVYGEANHNYHYQHLHLQWNTKLTTI